MSFEEAWDAFYDIPINDDDEIEKPFMGFEIGTHRFEIWHWFEEEFNIRVADYLFGGTKA